MGPSRYSVPYAVIKQGQLNCLVWPGLGRKHCYYFLLPLYVMFSRNISNMREIELYKPQPWPIYLIKVKAIVSSVSVTQPKKVLGRLIFISFNAPDIGQFWVHTKSRNLRTFSLRLLVSGLASVLPTAFPSGIRGNKMLSNVQAVIIPQA
jgi:hypothetical protein